MKKVENYFRILPWFTVLLLSVLATGCGGGGGGGGSGSSLVQNLGTGSAVATLVPTVTAVAPLPDAVGVSVSTKVISATFSKAMDPATLSSAGVSVACPAGTPVVGVVSYLATSNLATLALPAAINLAPNTLCTATVTTAAKDTTGVALANNFVWTFMTGATPDRTAPQVTATMDANGATSVAINTKIGATFTEAMDPTTITTATFMLKLGATPVAGTISYSGQNAFFIPASVLASNTTYIATITSGVKDLAGNAMVSDYVWSLTTGAAADTMPPQVTGTINANGATGVAINSRVGATFTKAMDPLTISTATFTLKQGTTMIAGMTSYTGVSAVFTPLSALANNTTYTATITTGAKDLAGNAMVSDYVWRWTTGAAADTTAPTVTGTINANGATNVAINTKIGATFSKAMDSLTITNLNFTVKESGSGNAVVGTVSYSGVNAVFSPLSNLASSTRYSVTVKGGVGGVADLAGNVMVSDYLLSWTTGAAVDTTAPIVSGTIHANGATNVAINTKIGATFSKAMDPLTISNLNFTVKESVSGNTVAGTVSYAGVNAVFSPLSNLASSTRYSVTIKGGVGGVADLAGHVMVSDYVLSWTTSAAADTTAPTVALVSPADLASNVAASSAVHATFSKAMDPLTINTTSFTVRGITGTVVFNAISKIATFAPSAALADGTTYTATVTTAAKDLAGNALAINKVWSFTTPAIPVVVPSPVNLGSASAFGTFGGSAGMTNSGTLTLVNGDIGTIATAVSAISGFHDSAGNFYAETPANMGAVNGSIYTCTNAIVAGSGPFPSSALLCGIATLARVDAQAAYLALAAMTPTANPAANLANLTLAPGIYRSASGSFVIEGGNLTLDAQGNANALWVFQMAQTLTVGAPGVAAPQSIILAGGAQAKNVYWQVGSFATINAAGGGTMVGTIISQAGASFSSAGSGAIVTLEGRALSLGAAVTMVNTVINVPAP